MEYFLQGHDYQIWSIIEEGDLVVTNEKAQWTDDDRKKIFLNCKAKSILCCALSKKEFNRVSACKSSMEMWEKLRITYEGTDKVKETRINILVTQYERFQMQSGESITQMFSRFTDITNGLTGLAKTYEIGDMVRKILRSLPSSWTPKVTAIEEANNRLRDGKLDINQLNAFNYLLHFIVCQILVPRSATFSTCSKADSDMMFWAIQNKEINMPAVMMERMTFARDQIWDTNSKLNVSLPYAHMLTKVFKHFGIDLAGAVVEKMGQSIRSRNLRKSGFSVIDGVWSKTTVAEGEAIIGDILDVQEEAAEPAAVVQAAVEQRIEIEPEVPSLPAELAEVAVEDVGSPLIQIVSQSPEGPEEEAMVGAADNLPTSIIASILRDVVDSVLTSPVTSETGGITKEIVASGHIEESVATSVQEEQSSAPSSVILEDAPIQGEQEFMEEDDPIQGEQSKEGQEEEAAHHDEPIGDVPIDEDLPRDQNDVREGETASSSDSDDDQPPPASEARQKGKEVELEVPLLSDTPHKRQIRQKIAINLKPVIERLDAQGTIPCSLQSNVSSIFMSQASATKEISNIRNAMKWFNQEMGSMKSLLGDILKVVGAQIPPPPPPASQVPESGPSRPSFREAGPTGPEAATAPAEVAANVEGPSELADQVKGPPGQAEQGSGPSGPLESESVQKEAEASLAPKPPAPSSPSHTPIPPTPPSAPTAPPAPQTFKKPQSRSVSSPAPFQSTSSPASSTTIPSPSPILEAPPASSAGASSSSSGPSLGSVDVLLTTSHSFLHPTPPPSFITIIPERAQLNSPFMEQIKDEFEEGILREYHQGHVSAEVLAPILSECERLTSSEWSKFYPLPAQQLFALNEAQAREGKPAISAATFLDMNSIHLVDDPFKVWEERYKVYVALH
ncbi:hypothetical protein Taro_002752 [Colocasia esculenta]|uniref:Uncharacterized protein n=1 Tax=Colocasia esculenta TaxID=4460 RepID=A0A843TPP5_COLES|nr:hypothetical protein [Colocasia esculenta]